MRPAPPVATASQSLVMDVMLMCPKTLPANVSVEQARAALDNDHVHMVLLTRGATLVGTLLRTDLPPKGTVGPAVWWSTLVERTVAPEESSASVRLVLVERGLRRAAVVDAEGTLLGLMCLKHHYQGFCSEVDVASRAEA